MTFFLIRWVVFYFDFSPPLLRVTWTIVKGNNGPFTRISCVQLSIFIASCFENISRKYQKYFTKIRINDLVFKIENKTKWWWTTLIDPRYPYCVFLWGKDSVINIYMLVCTERCELLHKAVSDNKMISRQSLIYLL